MSKAWAAAALSMRLVLGACDGNAGPSAALCSTPIEVSVTLGVAPQTAWTPAFGVYNQRTGGSLKE